MVLPMQSWPKKLSAVWDILRFFFAMPSNVGELPLPCEWQCIARPPHRQKCDAQLSQPPPVKWIHEAFLTPQKINTWKPWKFFPLFFWSTWRILMDLFQDFPHLPGVFSHFLSTWGWKRPATVSGTFQLTSQHLMPWLTPIAAGRIRSGNGNGEKSGLMGWSFKWSYLKDRKEQFEKWKSLESLIEMFSVRVFRAPGLTQNFHASC